ncbi:multifunctional CCA protein [endosymbiont of Euscepes postfasciatus]|uniref:hypothetical protein n=1 Tax=endosymbiont of Euscepes postfasciatus TaxID=650377 RepID=UPI000DC7032E|nr:hypothetical protein [endosymbiont of Euscepes postfasciatus]BBA84617.1 multifunctional CCA protein [endosymbiont of Euscepes postfasciatus]
MKIYLVGGAIRDSLLKLPIKEKDWVVVGSDINNMIKLGYKQVGKKFPVFIHPKSKEEYALARKEIKNNVGHKGFICFFSKKTTIIDDLYRRDLTINAIAKDSYNNIIDPFNGIKDIKNRIIKHVSNNFSDDPLRLLRVARFYSYLYHLNFNISLSTIKMLKKISYSGELKYISYDRIWKELKKTMLTNNPICFFRVLIISNSLNIIFPEIGYLLNNINNQFFFKKKFFKKNKNINHLEKNYIIRFLSLFYIIFKYYIRSNKNIKKKIFIFKNKINILSIKFNLPKKIKFILKKIDLIYKLDRELNNFNLFKIIDILHLLKINNNLELLNIIIKISFINLDKKIVFIDKKNKINYFKKDLIIKIFKLINCISIKDIILEGFINKNINNELIIRQKKKILLYFK